MNMEFGCIFSEKGKCVLRVDIATVPGDTCRISCSGDRDSKYRCPEWGPTTVSEHYYNAKLRME